jgi:DNA-binding response OmpR family regulator
MARQQIDGTKVMNIRVLLADPDESLLDTYRDCLMRQGFDVATASDGPECMTKLDQWMPDVLVLEPDMPNGWGEKILNRLAGRLESNTPVIILTRGEQRASRYPVREYRVKPWSMTALASAIHAVTKGQPQSHS